MQATPEIPDGISETVERRLRRDSTNQRMERIGKYARLTTSAASVVVIAVLYFSSLVEAAG